jgi:hypothetical protein
MNIYNLISRTSSFGRRRYAVRCALSTATTSTPTTSTPMVQQYLSRKKEYPGEITQENH